MSQTTKSIDQKLNLIMGEIGVVGKSGRNEQGRYNYLMEADLTRILNPLFVKYEVAFGMDITNMSKDGNLTTVTAEARFRDIPTGEEVRRIGMGQGWDTGDKGIYKAITGAKKYIWMTTFCIATGDDPENDRPTGKEVTGLVKNDPKVQAEMVKSGKPFPALSEAEIEEREKKRELDASKPRTATEVNQTKAPEMKNHPMEKVLDKIVDQLDMSHPDAWRDAVVIIPESKFKGMPLIKVPAVSIPIMLEKWKPKTEEEKGFRKHLESAAKHYLSLKEKAQDCEESFKEHDALAKALKEKALTPEDFMELAVDLGFESGKTFQELDAKKVGAYAENFNAFMFALKLKAIGVKPTDWMQLAVDPANDWADGSKVYIGIKPARFAAMLSTFKVMKEEYLGAKK